MGGLLLLTGPMFAGKSSALIAHARAMRALVLKPAFDTRDGPTLISSRDGTRIEAVPVSAWPAEAARAPALVIDEAQFMAPPHYRGDVVEDIRRAVDAGAQAVVGGIDADYRREPFEVVRRLAALAHRHVRLCARCHVCDAPAAWTAKKAETGHRLELGDNALYEARCDLHWTLPAGPASGRALPRPMPGAGACRE